MTPAKQKAALQGVSTIATKIYEVVPIAEAWNSRRIAGALTQVTRTHETAVSLAQRCGVHRNTVAEHTAILEAALMGTRQRSGELDAAFARIDALLREAGIVTDETREQAA